MRAVIEGLSIGCDSANDNANVNESEFTRRIMVLQVNYVVTLSLYINSIVIVIIERS